MYNLEKLMFLEMTNKQFSKLPNDEYYTTFKSLTPDELKISVKLSSELHNIWNYINSEPIENVLDNTNVNSIEDYHNSIAPVSDLILS